MSPSASLHLTYLLIFLFGNLSLNLQLPYLAKVAGQKGWGSLYLCLPPPNSLDWSYRLPS